jgi:hypothetical protein
VHPAQRRAFTEITFPKEAEMADVIYLAILFAFFGVAALFVVACDKIIGPDDVALREGLTSAPTTPTPEPEVEERRAAA